jgi:sugar transferase (PEP-CTERM/EpsH1 system associated)
MVFAAGTRRMSDILFLAHRIPYPPDKGDKIRSWRLLDHWLGRYRVHLGCFVDDPADLEHLPFLAERCASLCALPIRPTWRKLAALRALAGRRPLTFAYYADPRLRRWVEAVRARHDPAFEFAFSSGVAPYLDGATAPRLVDLVDLDAEKWRLYAARQRGPMAWLHGREARTLARAEAAIAASVDRTFLVSAAEAADLRARPGVPGERVAVVTNGVDTGFFDPAGDFAAPRPAPAIVFTGAMDYPANADAIGWFADAVWPALQRRRPDLELWVVGARPASAVRALAARPGIVVTGRVADVRPWLAHARLAIAPLRIARGLQNKVLEAMAMGKPVVASPAAAHGLDDAARKALITADGAGAMRSAIERLLDEPDRARHLGEAARRHVELHWTWTSRLAAFDDHLAALGIAAAPWLEQVA